MCLSSQRITRRALTQSATLKKSPTTPSPSPGTSTKRPRYCFGFFLSPIYKCRRNFPRNCFLSFNFVMTCLVVANKCHSLDQFFNRNAVMHPSRNAVNQLLFRSAAMSLASTRRALCTFAVFVLMKPTPFVATPQTEPRHCLNSLRPPKGQHTPIPVPTHSCLFCPHFCENGTE